MMDSEEDYNYREYYDSKLRQKKDSKKKHSHRKDWKSRVFYDK